MPIVIACSLHLSYFKSQFSRIVKGTAEASWCSFLKIFYNKGHSRGMDTLVDSGGLAFYKGYRIHNIVNFIGRGKVTFHQRAQNF